jgi:hypothetical protein
METLVHGTFPPTWPPLHSIVGGLATAVPVLLATECVAWPVSMWLSMAGRLYLLGQAWVQPAL